MVTIDRRTVLKLGAGAGMASLARPWLGEVEAAPAGRPFTVAINLEPDTLDPTSSHNTLGVKATLCNIVETLIGTAQDGSLVPGLATWTVSPDGKTVEFKLRPGVTFHNGDPLTAADVVFSDQRLAAHTIQYSTYRRKVFDSVETPDDHTVRFHLKHPDPAFLYLRLLVVASKSHFDKVGEKAFMAHPIGTGPYRFVGYSVGEYLDLAAYDGYWGAKPTVKTARFAFVKDGDTRVAQLRAGEADLAVNVPYTAVKPLAAAGYHMVKLAVPPTMSLRFYFANKHAPWADRRVRMAMAHAIDTEAIVRDLLQGVPLLYPGLAPGEPGYDPSLKLYRYDPALAKKLLAEAGYPHGFKMTLHYWTNFVVGVPEAAEAVLLYLRAVGIQVDAASSDVGTMIQTVVKVHRDPNIEFISISPVQLSNNTDPVASLLASYQSDSMTSAYFNPAFDKVVAEANTTIDPAKRADLIRQAVRILHDDVAMIPLWTQVSVMAMRKGVDFKPTERLGVVTVPLSYAHVA